MIDVLRMYAPSRSQFGYAYCPELVALGNVVDGFLHPDFITIGCDDDTTWHLVSSIYHQMVPGARFAKMSVTEAEIFKVALNFFLTLKITFANTVAQICESHPGVDVDNITQALGMDSRISPKFLKGGMPFGGFCFPRDVAAFNAMALEADNWSTLPSAVRIVNDILHRKIVEKIVDVSDCKASVISILGLSFKPGTPEIENSPSIDIIERLWLAGKTVTVHDPMAMDNAVDALGYKAGYYNDAKSCALSSPVVVIATAWPEYAELTEDDFQQGATVIDCWRLLKHLRDSERVKYVGLGIGE